MFVNLQPSMSWNILYNWTEDLERIIYDSGYRSDEIFELDEEKKYRKKERVFVHHEKKARIMYFVCMISNGGLVK